MIILFLSLLICAAVSILFLYKRQKNNYWQTRNVKQVGGLLRNFIFSGRSLAEVYKDVYDSHPNEPYVGAFLGVRPALVLRDLNNIQAVLAGDFQSFYSRGITLNPNDTLADNVLFIEDFARWKVLRQKLSPVFTSAKLRNMFYILDRCAKDFDVRIKENPSIIKNPFDALYTYTTASIAASVFGIDAKIKNAMDSPFLDMSKRAVAPSFKATIIFAIANTFPRLLSAFNLKAFADYEDFFIGVVRKVMAERRLEKRKRHDFIDICIELQDQGLMKDPTTGYELEPTAEVLAAQAFFFFVAGADTSSTTMHFTLLELSNNPEILKKVHSEVDLVLSGKSDLTFSDVEELKYLEMVVNEATRKYPPIGLMQRKCTQNTKMPIGGAGIDKDCLVIVPVYAVHRDERYYQNPELFDPERFSSENMSKIPKYAFMPFGEGNRICLGMRFARLQVLAGLAWLLRNFTLRPQSVHPKTFEQSVFALRLPSVRYDLVPRH